MDHGEEATSEENAASSQQDPSCQSGGDGGHQLEQNSPPIPIEEDSTSPAHAPSSPEELKIDGIVYKPYLSELQMPSIVKLMKSSLSEPYSIYTYRYFIHKWPQLCKLAMSEGECVGAVVCKLELHHYNVRRGYIAMLAVAKDFRRKKIGQCVI